MYWIPVKIVLPMALFTTALVLTACGGGGGDTPAKLTYTALVSFGDSLSDVGTYKVGAIDAAGGGRWTVNGTTAGPVNWTELLAGRLNVPAPCPAQTGLLSNIPQIPPVAVASHANCTNYAQGSARVTLPYGPNAAALQPFIAPETNIGLLAEPLVSQFSTQLAVHGNYTGKELVTVMAGANDIFMHLNAVSAAAAGGSSAVGAATLAGWTSAEQNAVAVGGSAAVNAAASLIRAAPSKRRKSVRVALGRSRPMRLNAWGTACLLRIKMPSQDSLIWRFCQLCQPCRCHQNLSPVHAGLAPDATVATNEAVDKPPRRASR